MPLNIIKASDPVEVSTIVIALYGQPGIGKTSLGFTCPNPLALDFDAGTHRSAFRKDAVRMKSWNEVAVLDAADLKGYDTIVVDTVGRALDMLTAQLIQDEPKLSTSSGALTLQGYGALKANFTEWLKRMRLLGKDVVLLAHDKEDKQGDETIVRPDVQGGSQQEILKAADAIGYIHVAGRNTVVDFSPSARWFAKNPAYMEPQTVPNFASNGEFGAELIDKIKETICAQGDQQREQVSRLEKWRQQVKTAKTAEDFNELLAEVNDDEKVAKDVRPQAKRILQAASKKAGLAYDKQLGAFAENE